MNTALSHNGDMNGPILETRDLCKYFTIKSGGITATLKAVDNVHNVSNVPVVAIVDQGELEDAKDPDEFVRTHGVDAFRSVVLKAVPSPVYRARTLLESVTP